MADKNAQDQKDYQDYLDYQHYLAASKQAQNPQNQTIPDAADKASRPKQPYMSPGETPTDNYWTNVKARITDPERYKAIMGMDSPAKPETIGDSLGAAGLTIPMEAAPAGLAKLASYLGGSGVGPAMGRIAANGAIGGLQGGLPGALKGAAMGAGSEAISGLVSGGGNMGQTIRLAANPAKAQDQAISAIDDATGKLKSSEAENLAKYLGDKTLTIDTTRIRGIHPEIDEILNTAASKGPMSNPTPAPAVPPQAEVGSEFSSSFKPRGVTTEQPPYTDLQQTKPSPYDRDYSKPDPGLGFSGISDSPAYTADPKQYSQDYGSPEQGLGFSGVSEGVTSPTPMTYGVIPSEVTLPATDANKIRSLLDQEMTYKKLGPYAQTAETAARDAVIKPQADQLRAQIHELSPEVSDTLDQWSDNLNAARNLDKRAQTAPTTVLTSPSFDRRALLQKVDEQAGTDLQGLGAQLNNAKDLSNAFHNGGVHPIDALTTLGRAAAQGALKGSKLAIPLDAASQGLFNQQQK